MLSKTIEECRKTSCISKEILSEKLGVSLEEYERFESYENEMSVLQGLIFARLTSTPINNIIFFAY